MRNTPPIYRVTGKSHVEAFGERIYVPDPEGEGLLPVLEKDRGDLVIPCPDCEKPLVREVNAEAWERAIVRCPSCRGVFTGREYPYTEPVKER